MNYFLCLCWLRGAFSSGTGISAVAVWIPHDPPTTVFRAGLVYSDHVTLEHHSCFIWLLLLLFFSEGSKPSYLSHQQCSHVNALIQDLVFARSISSLRIITFGLMAHFYDMFHVI